MSEPTDQSRDLAAILRSLQPNQPNFESSIGSQPGFGHNQWIAPPINAPPEQYYSNSYSQSYQEQIPFQPSTYPPHQYDHSSSIPSYDYSHYLQPPKMPHATEPDHPAVKKFSALKASQLQVAPEKSQPPSKTSVDSTTITEWTSGLRHVTKLAANNEQLGESIKKMIENQHNHEAEWAAGREALMRRLKDQEEDKRKLDVVLRSIGSDLSNETSTTIESELKTYDIKVHRAATKMEKDMSRELASMGVPFFGVKESLIAPDEVGGGRAKGKASEDAASENINSVEGVHKITRKELRELQKRMIIHLEDLYGD